MNEHNPELVTEDSNFAAQPLKRTNFFISFCYLIVQVLLPGLVLFFLTSRDFNFAFRIPLWLMVILALTLLLFAVAVTFVTYKFKLHQLDQFTYVIPFAGFIIGLYLTSYWLDYHYFLIRFIIGFVSAIIGIFLASMILLLVVRKKSKK